MSTKMFITQTYIQSYIMSYIKIKHFKQRVFWDNNVHTKTS